MRVFPRNAGPSAAAAGGDVMVSGPLRRSGDTRPLPVCDSASQERRQRGVGRGAGAARGT